jgi:hypothetical protein
MKRVLSASAIAHAHSQLEARDEEPPTTGAAILSRYLETSALRTSSGPPAVFEDH